jgi:DNA-directed RNA polymerase specialized sigma24 family protein
MIKPEDFFKFVDNIKDEDYRQDCYLTIIEKAKDFIGTDFEFEKYIKVTLHFDKIDYYKAEQKRKNNTVSLDTIPPNSETGESYAGLILDSSDLQDEIEIRYKISAAKSQMPSKEYAVLELFHRHDLTAKEIYRDYKDLNLKNIKQVYNIILKYKKYEAE